MESDKPFKCSKCGLCFANVDHLVVHHLVHCTDQKKLQVKIPKISNGPVADQTPTPTRFLKTADVEGSQLFEEINPFDQDFKLASKQQNAEQHPSVGSSTDNSHIIMQKMVSSGSKDQKEHPSSTTGPDSNQTTNKGPETSRTVSVITPISSPSQGKTFENSNVALIQAVLRQLQNAKQETSSAEVTPKNSPSQDSLRDQLKTLIKSGQIKIQFSPDLVSQNVAATTGETKLNSPAQTVVKTSDLPSNVVTTQLQETTVTPMSLLSVPSLIPSSRVVHSSHPDSNLALAKQKLKAVIQSSSENHVNGTGRQVTVFSNTSSQGKYKDIKLEDENNFKRKRVSEEMTPEEKRNKFLERNRAAASRCRQKRKIWVNQLEKKSDVLVQTNSTLMNEITALRNEVAQLKALLLAHKDCPVTLQQKALLGQINSTGYVTVSDGQIIAIQTIANARPASTAEEVASSALTDMASRASVEINNRITGTVTVQASDGSVTSLPSHLLNR